MGCWDDEHEAANYIAASHWATVTAHARIALHPEVITVNHAEAVKEAAVPLINEKNVADAQLLVWDADRHHTIARTNAWCH